MLELSSLVICSSKLNFFDDFVGVGIEAGDVCTEIPCELTRIVKKCGEGEGVCVDEVLFPRVHQHSVHVESQIFVLLRLGDKIRFIDF